VSAPQLEILAIAVVTAAGCALVGVFLMLRRLAMLSDAISHAILPGIVLAFFVTRDLASPWLMIAAVLTGLLTVVMVEALSRSRRLKEDAAMGLVFPAMFSVGIVLITVTMLNLLAITVFFKELKLATFDAGLAASLGLAPAAIHYGLMALVSVTAVGAFDAVGLILVVALMIGPAAAAYLLTDRLGLLLVLAVALGALSAGLGFALAIRLDASIAGCMAVGVGAVFGAVFLLAPGRGLISALRRRRRQRWEFAQVMLAIHLLQHEGGADEDEESRVEHLHGKHVGWTPAFTARVVDGAQRHGLVEREAEQLRLTASGREAAGRTLSGRPR